MINEKASGTVPLQAFAVDYEQAKRELTGESNTDVQAAMLETIPESEGWDPVEDGFAYAMDKSVLPMATSVSAR